MLMTIISSMLLFQSFIKTVTFVVPATPYHDYHKSTPKFYSVLRFTTFVLVILSIIGRSKNINFKYEKLKHNFHG